jgi:hypothetical protein
MDAATYVHKQKARYMAQLLEEFEEKLEGPLKEAGLNGEIQNFKGMVRAKKNTLATDAVDIFSVGDGQVQNEAGIEVRDQIRS